MSASPLLDLVASLYGDVVRTAAALTNQLDQASIHALGYDLIAPAWLRYRIEGTPDLKTYIEAGRLSRKAWKPACTQPLFLFGTGACPSDSDRRRNQSCCSEGSGGANICPCAGGGDQCVQPERWTQGVCGARNTTAANGRPLTTAREGLFRRAGHWETGSWPTDSGQMGCEADRVWHGHIERTPITVITVTTRNVGEVLVKIDDSDSGLLPDTNVTVTVTTSSEANVLSVPREALHSENGRPYVFKVVDDKIEEPSSNRNHQPYSSGDRLRVERRRRLGGNQNNF